MSFRFNWQFTFKVNELIPALERKIVDLKAELEKAQAKKEADELPPEVKDAQKLLQAYGLIDLPLRRVRQPTNKNTQLRRDVVVAERLLWLLRREDPHRQYKLDWDDVDYFAGYIVGESNAD